MYNNIKHKTIEEMLNKWNRELEGDVTAFTKLAVQISKWDKQLLDAGDTVSLETFFIESIFLSINDYNYNRYNNYTRTFKIFKINKRKSILLWTILHPINRTLKEW